MVNDAVGEDDIGKEGGGGQEKNDIENEFLFHSAYHSLLLSTLKSNVILSHGTIYHLYAKRSQGPTSSLDPSSHF